mmetsp:Transcript_15978/g.26327  ORF Transcript_15978/g.26327 Transcript_15978/m.26327 type:complete len:217 (+) Transcript_15978:207-857(+)
MPPRQQSNRQNQNQRQRSPSVRIQLTLRLENRIPRYETRLAVREMLVAEDIGTLRLKTLDTPLAARRVKEITSMSNTKEDVVEGENGPRACSVEVGVVITVVLPGKEEPPLPRAAPRDPDTAEATVWIEGMTAVTVDNTETGTNMGKAREGTAAEGPKATEAGTVAVVSRVTSLNEEVEPVIQQAKKSAMELEGTTGARHPILPRANQCLHRLLNL